MLEAVATAGQSLGDFTAELKLLPQVLVNVRTSNAGAAMQDARVRDAVSKAERELAGRGRVLLRPSGTEPLLRVMVEGEQEASVRGFAEAIASAVRLAAQAA